MNKAGRAVILAVVCWVGCAETRDTTTSSGAPSTAADAGEMPPAEGADAAAAPGAGMEPSPVDMSGVDAGGEPDEPGMQPMPSGDACLDAAMRVAGCFLSRETSGTPACRSGASDAAPTVARFLIGGGSCPTLTKQGITLATPCDQAPLPMHVMQLVGYEPAAKLCSAGPANSAATCTAACANAAPCVDSRMLDEKLKDPAVCFDGCIRNAEDKAAFACSAGQTDCGALADMCWTE